MEGTATTKTKTEAVRSLAADGARTWRVGTRMRLDSGLAVSLQGTRAEPVSAAARHTLALAATLSW